MTTLCRCDWIEAQAEQELRLAQIDLQKLPTSSFDKIAAMGNSAPIPDSRLQVRASIQNN